MTSPPAMQRETIRLAVVTIRSRLLTARALRLTAGDERRQPIHVAGVLSAG